MRSFLHRWACKRRSATATLKPGVGYRLDFPRDSLPSPCSFASSRLCAIPLCRCRCRLLSRPQPEKRTTERLPCGDVCLDPTSPLPANRKTTKTSKGAFAATVPVAGKSKSGTRHSASGGDDIIEKGSGGKDRHRRRRRSPSASYSDGTSGGDSGRDGDTGSGPSRGRGRQSGKGETRAGVVGLRAERSRRDGGGPDGDSSSGTSADLGGKDVHDSGSDGGSGSSIDGQGLSKPMGRRKRPRHDETRRRGAGSSSNNITATTGVVAASGGEGAEDGAKTVEYFPLNAGALRAAVEEVPENALCGHRHLAPLVDLLSSGEPHAVCVRVGGGGDWRFPALCCGCVLHPVAIWDSWLFCGGSYIFVPLTPRPYFESWAKGFTT